ncbi:MAG: F0F1 ATP synthase subunit A [Acidobacteriaceae bacterium]
MPVEKIITEFLNHLLAGPATHLLTLLGHAPQNPAAPINGTFAMQFTVFAMLLVFFIVVRLTLNVEKPGSVQQIAELMNEFVSEQGDSIIGHGYERFVPFLAVIFLFVILCNFMGLLPGVDTPTANPTVPLGIALVTFLYYHWHGVRAKGPIGYAKHFLGPLWWIAPLMLPIEIISHLARILSLTIRLYANMFASDLLTLIFFSLFPFALPVVFLGLHFGVSVIQAYVFMLLATIYLGQAVAHEH